jgi:hypothetical protein
VAMCSIEDNQVESSDLHEAVCTSLHPCEGFIAYKQHLFLMFVISLRIYGCEEEMTVASVGTTQMLPL